MDRLRKRRRFGSRGDRVQSEECYLQIIKEELLQNMP
jgi:hypothetical protein